MPESRLVRFVSGPGGEVTPDIARKLPGRGMWVASDRASIDSAVKANLFARAAKSRLIVPANLSDLVDALLRRRLLSALGMARKAGDLTLGFEKVSAAVAAGKVAFLVEASDGAADGRRKLISTGRHSGKPPRLVGVFSTQELSLALGGETVVHTAFLAGRGADRWSDEVERLSGFRPLLPEGWCEER